MNFLETIIAHKREEVAARKKQMPLSELMQMPLFQRKPVSLANALREKNINIIAEIKKASPSKNVIRNDFNPIDIAHQYVKGGASAISVLTDTKFFLGDIAFVEQMRDSVPVPILRKDFTIDSYQLVEAKAYGADAVLLIAAVLGSHQLTDLALEAASLGLESLVEVHNEEEAEALDLSAVRIVGINNRDLYTFETDIYTSVRVKKFIPEDTIIVSESGIAGPKDIEMLISNGIHAFLIGELFMRAENPGEALDSLIKQTAG